MIRKKGYKKIVGKCCFECGKFIDPTKDHYVQLNTINRSISPDEYTNFHFQCWVDYFNQRVENKMKAQVRFMQEKAISLFNSPMIKQALSQIQGSDIAMNMLKTPLNADPVLKQKIKKKLNGKQKRSGKKRKAQVHKV